MKKLFVLGGILFLAACSTTKKNEVVISGTIKGLDKGEIYFIHVNDEHNIDTVHVSNGQFKYTGILNEPTVFMVNFGPEHDMAAMFVEPGNMNLLYDMSIPQSLEVHGGKQQELYNSFFDSCKKLIKSQDSIEAIAQKNSDKPELLNQLESQFMQLDSTLKVQQKTFFETNKSSLVAAFVALNYLDQKESKSLEEVEAIYRGFDKTLQESFYGKKLKEMATMLKNTSIGQAAGDFTLQDINGKSVSLSSFKGKITLLDFWASWCGPCRAENPNVLKVYNKFHAKGFEILAVSLDNQKAQWEAAIKKDGLTWTQVSDLQGWQSKVAAQFGVQAIPTNYLLDQNGVILAKGLRGADLEKRLAELIK